MWRFEGAGTFTSLLQMRRKSQCGAIARRRARISTPFCHISLRFLSTAVHSEIFILRFYLEEICQVAENLCLGLISHGECNGLIPFAVSVSVPVAPANENRCQRSLGQKT